MKLGSLLAGIGLGAGLMYLLDPDRGGHRRTTLQQRAGKASKPLAGRARHLRNRAAGLLAEARRQPPTEAVADAQLVARVRSKLGLVVSRPRDIEVVADEGRVILSGPIPVDEVDRLLQTVAAVPGVALVENWLEEFDDATTHEAPQRLS